MNVVSNAGSEVAAEAEVGSEAESEWAAATRSMNRFIVKEALFLIVNSSASCMKLGILCRMDDQYDTASSVEGFVQDRERLKSSIKAWFFHPFRRGRVEVIKGLGEWLEGSVDGGQDMNKASRVGQVQTGD